MTKSCQTLKSESEDCVSNSSPRRGGYYSPASSAWRSLNVRRKRAVSSRHFENRHHLESDVSKLSSINLKMRVRRQACGLSQKELAVLAEVGIHDVQAMEQFTRFLGELPDVNSKLQRVAHALDADFDDMFPRAYLQDLERQRPLPERKRYNWLRETAMGDLPVREILSIPADDLVEEVSSRMNHAALIHMLNRLLGELTAYQRAVLEKRFGLDGEGTKTLEEVGAQFGVTRERIRQLEAHALRRLRHPTRTKKLKMFL